jgi:hypothetical protein
MFLKGFIIETKKERILRFFKKPKKTIRYGIEIDLNHNHIQSLDEISYK